MSNHFSQPLAGPAFGRAAKAYYNDEQFADFTIIDGDTLKEYKVHRVFLCAQSEWFKKCCGSSFFESSDHKVELKDDVSVAIEMMIEFFYCGDYTEPETIGHLPMNQLNGRANPTSPAALHAHVYAIADKYLVLTLKALALHKFKGCSFHASPEDIKSMAVAVSSQIELPEDDRALHDAVFRSWKIHFKPSGGTTRQKRYPDPIAVPKRSSEIRYWCGTGLSAVGQQPALQGWPLMGCLPPQGIALDSDDEDYYSRPPAEAGHAAPVQTWIDLDDYTPGQSANPKMSEAEAVEFLNEHPAFATELATFLLQDPA